MWFGVYPVNWYAFVYWVLRVRVRVYVCVCVLWVRDGDGSFAFVWAKGFKQKYKDAVEAKKLFMAFLHQQQRHYHHSTKNQVSNNC